MSTTQGCLLCCYWQHRDSIDTEKSPMKSKHVTIETMETVDTEVEEDGHGMMELFSLMSTTRR